MCNFSPIIDFTFFFLSNASLKLYLSLLQPTLIIWGEQDRIFPLELAHRLERYAYAYNGYNFSSKKFLYELIRQLFSKRNESYENYRHLGENSQLVVIKNAGHAANLEKSKEVCGHIKAFFLNFSLKSPKNRMVWGLILKIYFELN